MLHNSQSGCSTIFLSEIMSLNCIQLYMSKKLFHLEQLASADAIHVSWGVCMLCHRAHHVLSSLPHPPGHHLGWSIPVWFMLVSFWCIPMFYLNLGSNAGWKLSYIAIMKWAFKGPGIA